MSAAWLCAGQAARGAGMPAGGALRSIQMGLETAMTTPSEPTTWLRRKHGTLVSTATSTHPLPILAAG